MKEFFLVLAFLFSALFVVFLIIAFGWFLVWTLLVRRFRFVRELFMIKDSPTSDVHNAFRLQPSCKPGLKTKTSIQNSSIHQQSEKFSVSCSNSTTILNKEKTVNKKYKNQDDSQEEGENKENISFRERQLVGHNVVISSSNNLTYNIKGQSRTSINTVVSHSAKLHLD